MIVKIDDLILQWGYNKVWNTPTYQTAIMFNDNPDVQMDETPYYHALHKYIDAFGVVCESVTEHSQVDAKCEKFRNLYKSIKAEGLKKKIDVFIGDNGEILVLDGSHRVSILAALGKTHIQTVVGRADPALEKFLTHEKKRGYSDKWAELLDNINKIKPNFLYAPIDHPFFNGFDIWRVSKDRLAAIEQHLSASDKVLDIGSNIGYFPHRLRQAGIFADGVENNPVCVDIAYALNYVYHVWPRFFLKDALEHLRENKSKYTAVLALSVIHHLERVNGIEYLKELFALTPDKLFLEVVRDGEELAQGIEIKAGTVRKWMAENTKYNVITELRRDIWQGRPLFLCEVK